MSYREENGQIVLTMSRDDYEIVLMALGAFTAMTWQKLDGGKRVLEVMDRIQRREGEAKKS